MRFIIHKLVELIENEIKPYISCGHLIDANELLTLMRLKADISYQSEPLSIHSILFSLDPVTRTAAITNNAGNNELQSLFGQ